MMPVSSHGPPPDQEPILVEIDGIGEVEFDAGTSPDVIQAKVRELTTPKRPEQILAEADPNYLPPDPDRGQRMVDNLPMMGALAAGTAASIGSGGILLPAIAAGGGGFLGARLRGDSREDAAFEGVKQGALQGAGGAVVKGGQAVARGIMRGGIPKNIQADFGGRAVAQEALDTGAIPGSARSADRITRLSKEANSALKTTAQNVPTLKSRKIIDGLRKLHDEATAAKMPDRAKAITERAGEIRREVGTGLDGTGQLARKGIRQFEGRASLKAPNSKMAGLESQMADAERDAVMSHLHETPGMKDALNVSQRRMGLDRFMQDSLTSNLVNRMGGGPMNMLRSPTGLGVVAHGVNQGRQIANPNVIRLLDLIMRGGAHE